MRGPVISRKELRARLAPKKDRSVSNPGLRSANPDRLAARGTITQRSQHPFLGRPDAGRRSTGARPVCYGAGTVRALVARLPAAGVTSRKVVGKLADASTREKIAPA